ncbi:MAG: MMPL family transporter [Clostridia bacterium]|nr:MMPL family transporter [Clostridia bacterium]
MHKLSNWIMNHKLALVITFTVLIVLSVVGVFFVQKESDLIVYLDKDSDTIVSKKILENEYDIIGDCNLAISYATEKDVERIVSQFKSTPIISDYLAKDPVWIGTFNKLSMAGNAFDTEQAMANAREKFVKTTEYTFTTIIDGKEVTKTELVDTYIISLYFKTAGGDEETIAALDEIDKIIRGEEKSEGSGTYTSYIKRHIDAQDGIGPKDINDWYYIGGNAQNARNILKSSLGDMPKFILVAVAVCLVILLLTTQSYLEPLIFLATLGISILLNMGSNIIAGNPIGKISSITSSCATILQLAIAMDYSIFLMHTYYEELKLHPQPKDALIAALPKTISAISASMLTTVGGFLALFFMDYGIGYDLGFVLAKGVILSLLSTVFLQPILILILSKGIKKTKHKWIFAPKLKFISKGITHPAVAAIVVVLVLGLALPCAYFQLQVPLSYVATSVDNPDPNLPEQMASMINNQAIVLVPYEGPESMDKHLAFVEKVKKIGYEPELDADGKLQYEEDGSLKMKLSEDTSHVIEVFSLATILSKDDFESIENSSLKNIIYSLLYDNFIANREDSDKQSYMLYTITLNNTDSEGKITNRIETQYSYNALREIKFAAMESFENCDLNNANEPYLKVIEAQKTVANLIAQQNTNYDEYKLALEPINQFKDNLMNNSTSYQIYLTGLAQGSYDLATVTPNDFLLVTLLSAAIVLLILLFTFKNVKLSIILMLVIESGIWINLSLVYFTSLVNPAHTINFVAYLIVTAIELGATVDYAIMLTTKYLEEKKSGVKSVQSIKNAINRAAPGVTTSALILIGVCALVHLITTNMIVGQITRLLAIGTTMSYVFVFTLLPAILSFDERIKRAWSIKRGKGDPDKGRLMYNPNYYNQDGTHLPEVVIADESAIVEMDVAEAVSQIENDSAQVGVFPANDEITADVTTEVENSAVEEKTDKE